MGTIKQKPLNETAAYQGIKKLWKLATKNMIPKSYEQVMAMKKNLEQEERKEIEKQEAIKTIKDIIGRRKQKRIDIKKARRAKIKRFLRLGH